MAQFDDFICNSPGPKSNAQSPTGLQIGHFVSINGSESLADFITGDDGAAVYSIQLLRKDGFISDYRLRVNGKGPSKGTLTSLDLKFTDGTGDTYGLSIVNSTKGNHDVDFSSSDPRITNIAWA